MTTFHRITTLFVCILLCLPLIACQAYHSQHPQNPKFANQNPMEPWNDPLKKDDPLAPWNNPLKKDDPNAPWNNPYHAQTNFNHRNSNNNDTMPAHYPPIHDPYAYTPSPAYSPRPTIEVEPVPNIPLLQPYDPGPMRGPLNP